MMAALIAGSAGCKKHKTYPKTPAPVWEVDQTGKYSMSMSAVVQVSGKLMTYVQTGDRIGAFIDDTCRGLGTLVKLDTSRVFFVLIHGMPVEQKKISFKYYSTWSSNLYETGAFLGFTMDGHYGTVDDPAMLELTHAKK